MVGDLHLLHAGQRSEGLRVDGSVDYALNPKLTLSFGAWYEDYKFSDYAVTGLPNLEPSAFFIAANNGPYNATVGFVRLSYHW